MLKGHCVRFGRRHVFRVENVTIAAEESINPVSTVNKNMKMYIDHPCVISKSAVDIYANANYPKLWNSFVGKKFRHKLLCGAMGHKK